MNGLLRNKPGRQSNFSGLRHGGIGNNLAGKIFYFPAIKPGNRIGGLKHLAPRETVGLCIGKCPRAIRTCAFAMHAHKIPGKIFHMALQIFKIPHRRTLRINKNILS